MAYAQGTGISTEQTRGEIERLLVKSGCDQFYSGWKGAEAYVAFRAKDRYVRFVLPLPARDEERFTTKRTGQYSTKDRSKDEGDRLHAQACRERWRSLLLAIKAKMDSVDTGIETFEQAFLAQIVLPDGKLMGDYAKAAIERAYASGSMPQLLPHSEDD